MSYVRQVILSSRATTPALYDRRIIELDPGNYWELQKYMPCGLPDREEGAYWVWVGNSPSFEEAFFWLSKRHGLHRPHDSEDAGDQGSPA